MQADREIDALDRSMRFRFVSFRSFEALGIAKIIGAAFDLFARARAR